MQLHLVNRRSISGLFPLVSALLPFLGDVSVAAGKGSEVPLTPQGEKLLATYTEILDSLKAEIAAAAPKVDEQKKAVFLAAHAAVARVPAPPNPRMLKVSPPRYADSNPTYKKAQAKALLAARAILPDVAAFLGSDRLHGKMVKCALLRRATPRGLAGCAQVTPHEDTCYGRHSTPRRRWISFGVCQRGACYNLRDGLV